MKRKVAALPWRLLYLGNNFHALHHERPDVAWYKLAEIYARERERLLADNGGYLIEPNIVTQVRSLDGEVIMRARHPQVCKPCELEAIQAARTAAQQPAEAPPDPLLDEPARMEDLFAEVDVKAVPESVTVTPEPPVKLMAELPPVNVPPSKVPVPLDVMEAAAPARPDQFAAVSQDDVETGLDSGAELPAPSDQLPNSLSQDL